MPEEQVIRGENDFATVFPSFARDWDFEMNTVYPEDVGATSKKRYWWHCDNGHKYFKSVYQRSHYYKGCPKCNASVLEQAAYTVLDKHGWTYECEYVPLEMQYNGRYDIFLLSYRVVIELDGEQHFDKDVFNTYSSKITFAEAVERDNIKTAYCFEKGISLLRIPYVYCSVNRIEQFLLEFLHTKLIPQDIIYFYSNFEDNIYARYAKEYNCKQEQENQKQEKQKNRN